MDWLTQFLQNPGQPGFLQPVGGEAMPPPMVAPAGPGPGQYNMGPDAQAQPAQVPDTMSPSLGASLAGPQAQGVGGLSKMLSGLAAPKPPDVVKPSTPAAPQTKPIAGGDLLALIQQLGARGAAAPRPTLGGAVGIGRY